MVELKRFVLWLAVVLIFLYTSNLALQASISNIQAGMKVLNCTSEHPCYISDGQLCRFEQPFDQPCTQLRCFGKPIGINYTCYP